MRKIFISITFILVIISSTLSINAFAAEMADGIYEVNIALWHSEDDKESMAADSVGKKATIVVENGIKTMHITSGEMSMMGIKASLQELRIADAKGNFTDANVESRDSEENPTGFYFVMPHTEEYITVKVNPYLAIMGNRDISARIKVDYSTLKLIKSSETAVESEPQTTLIPTEISSSEATTESLIIEENEEVSEILTESITSETATAAKSSSENLQSEKNNTAVTALIAAAAAVIIIFAAVKIKKNR